MKKLKADLLRREMEILGYMLRFNDLIPHIKSKLKNTRMLESINQRIFDNITSLHSNGKPIDPVSVSRACEINTSEIIDIFDSVFDGQEKNVDLFLKDYLRIHDSIFMSLKSPASLIEKGLTPMGVIENLKTDCVHEFDESVEKHSKDLAYDSLLAMQDLKQNSVAIAFPLLGSLLALKKKQLVVISARPKVGKTTFALNLVNQIAKEGKKCLIFSFEMSGFEIVQKLVSLNYPKADKDLDYTKKVQNFLRKSHGENIVIIESSGLSPAEIKLKIQTHNPEIVIIDQLDCLPLNHRIERHDLRVGENVSALKKIAIETGTLLFLLHQLNRGADAKITPELQNLKDTSIVEQKADIVLMLWEKIISGYPTFFCRIGANRMGDTGTVSFDFLKSASLFLEKGIHLCEE